MKFKHHDTGFRSIELTDPVSSSKRNFNRNSVSTHPFKHEDASIRFKKLENRANGYNLINGTPIEIV